MRSGLADGGFRKVGSFERRERKDQNQYIPRPV